MVRDENLGKSKCIADFIQRRIISFLFCASSSTRIDVVADAEMTEVLEVPERPEGPLEIFDVAETRATLQWYPPRDAGGGPIIGYIIDARELDKIDIIR
jgi:hypothetical protein